MILESLEMRELCVSEIIYVSGGDDKPRVLPIEPYRGDNFSGDLGGVAGAIDAVTG